MLGREAEGGYLSGLFLESTELLDGSLKVGLVYSQYVAVRSGVENATFASSSASGSCLSTSFEWSLSGRSTASLDMMAVVCCDIVVYWVSLKLYDC